MAGFASRIPAELRDDVEFLSRVRMSLLNVLEKKGALTCEELKGAIDMDADDARDSLGVKRRR